MFSSAESTMMTYDSNLVKMLSISEIISSSWNEGNIEEGEV